MKLALSFSLSLSVNCSQLNPVTINFSIPFSLNTSFISERFCFEGVLLLYPWFGTVWFFNDFIRCCSAPSIPGSGRQRRGLGRASSGPHGSGARTPHRPPPPPQLSPAVIPLLSTACPARCPPALLSAPAPGPAGSCQASPPRQPRLSRPRGSPLPRDHPLHPALAYVSWGTTAPGDKLPTAPARPPGDPGSGSPGPPDSSPRSPDPQPPAVSPLTARTGGPAQGAAAWHVGADVVLSHDAHGTALLAPQLQHFLRAEHCDGEKLRPPSARPAAPRALAHGAGGGATVRGRASVEGREKVGLVVGAFADASWGAALRHRRKQAEGTGGAAEGRRWGAGTSELREPGPQLRGDSEGQAGASWGNRSSSWGEALREPGRQLKDGSEGRAGASWGTRGRSWEETLRGWGQVRAEGETDHRQVLSPGRALACAAGWAERTDSVRENREIWGTVEKMPKKWLGKANEKNLLDSVRL